MQAQRIWLFMDRAGNADDNAEHLFNYCTQICDDINKYFVLNEDSPDFERLKKVGNVIPFGSRQHKLLHLFAEKLVYSDMIFSYRFPFGPHESADLFMGLSKAKLIFLQHGVTKDDMSDLFGLWAINAKIFITSSTYEYDSVLKGYGYDKDIVQLLGFPRYDSLQCKRKRCIVILPTWRNNLTISDPATGERAYNDIFKNSVFYSAINNILTDPRLIASAAKLGYSLLFKPHPHMYLQIDDYDLRHAKIIDRNESYQEMFGYADLIVTDYSSAVFDFAYLKKPVLYYHFDDRPLGSGYFDYETMGFGDIAYEHGALIDLIIQYMESNCDMPDMYKKRVDSFFAFTDTNNCKRVYDALK